MLMEWKTIQIDWVLMEKYWKRGLREDWRGLKQISHEKPFKKLFLGVLRLGESWDESRKKFPWNFLSPFGDLSAHLWMRRERVANLSTWEPKNAKKCIFPISWLKSREWVTQVSKIASIASAWLFNFYSWHLTLQLQACASHEPFSREPLLINFLRVSHETTLIFISYLILHQLNTKPNTIKSHKIRGTKLM